MAARKKAGESGKPNLDDYVDVAERIAQFYEKYPEGSIQTIEGPTYVTVNCEVPGVMDPATGIEPPPRLAQKVYVVVKAAAFRSPEDKLPGIGSAAEPVPGRTPYTKDSETQNAETSAWGRAIVACNFVTKRIASRQEVVNRMEPAEQAAALGDEWAAAAPVVAAPVVPAPVTSAQPEPQPAAPAEAPPAPPPAAAAPPEAPPAAPAPDFAPPPAQAAPAAGNGTLAEVPDVAARVAEWVRSSGVPMAIIATKLAALNVEIVNSDLGDTLLTMTPAQVSDLEMFVRGERQLADTAQEG